MNDVVERRLTERVKELTALHRTSRILQDHERPTHELMAEITDQLPGAWQFPEVAAARIRFRGEQYLTEGFRDSVWSQRAEFAARSGEGGDITVVYFDERPAADEGPFLLEERELIESLADMLRSHLEHVLKDEALREARDVLETHVLARTADLRRLASQLTLAEERERRRIASDLHDHVGQSLAILKMRMREFRDNAVFSGYEESIDEIVRLIDQTIRYTRHLTGEISPPVLYELGLEPALQWLAEYFTVECRFHIRYRTQGRARPLPEELSVMVFLSARELLTNSLKHSGATEASLDLTWGVDALSLRVRDRGCGFDPGLAAAAAAEGFGLFSIRERIGDLGGDVAIESRPGAGCRVAVSVPLPRHRAPEEQAAKGERATP